MAKGGGTRAISYKRGDLNSVDSLINLGKKLFFPNGKCRYGLFSDMSVELSTREGIAIKKFTDLEGNTCNFQEHLKSMGIYSSQYYTYIRTELKDGSPEKQEVEVEMEGLTKQVGDIRTENQEFSRIAPEVDCHSEQVKAGECQEVEGQHVTFYVNGMVPPEIRIRYSKEIYSDYSIDTSWINCSTVLDCWAVSSGNIDFNDYNPCIDGFRVTSIEVFKQKLFEIDLEKNTPAINYDHEPQMDNDIFLYPVQAGFESNNENYLVLAVVLKENNDQTIHWFKDNVRILTGINLCVIKVTESGLYTCGVDYGTECKILVNAVSVEKIYSNCKGMSAKVQEELGFIVTDMQHPPDQTLDTCNVEHECDNITPKIAVSFKTESHPTTEHTPKVQISVQKESEPTPEQTSTSDVHVCLEKGAEPPQELSSNMQVSLTSNMEPSLKQEKCKRHSEINCEGNVPVPAKKSLTTVPITPDAEDTSSIGLNSSDSKPTVPKISLTELSFGDEIGKGAFGVVKKADWLGTTVAVKEIVVRRMKLARSMIERELKVHSAVRHPNILQLLAYATIGNKLLLVTEFIDGKNLDDILFVDEDIADVDTADEDTVQAWNISTKLIVATKIIQAVAYLHNQKPAIIHRDIKPENVLISKDFQAVRLCDYGLSKLKTFNTVVTTVASTEGLQPGTPAFQAPEVLVDKKSSDTKSDIWSLACTIVELLCEEPLWKGDEDLIRSIQNKMKRQAMPDGMASLLDNHDIPAEVSHIIDKCLSYESDKRPSALELLQVFKNYSSV